MFWPLSETRTAPGRYRSPAAITTRRGDAGVEPDRGLTIRPRTERVLAAALPAVTEPTMVTSTSAAASTTVTRGQAGAARPIPRFKEAPCRTTEGVHDGDRPQRVRNPT